MTTSLLRVDADDGARETYTSDVVLVSLQLPLNAITLSNASDGEPDQTVYQCDTATDPDCMVDIAAADPMTDMLFSGPIEVEPGTYDAMQIGNCVGTETDFEALVAAAGMLDGVIYRTDGTGLSEGSDDPDPTPLTYSGCGSEYPIVPPLVIAEGDDVGLQVYFDTRAAVYISDGETDAYHMNGPCTGSGAGAPFVCAPSYDMSATIDETPPTVERYYLDNEGIVGLMINSSDTFFGGYLRKNLHDGVDATPLTEFGGHCSLDDNSDGTFTLTDGNGGWSSPDFQRVPEGQQFDGTYDGGASTYTAIRTN